MKQPTPMFPRKYAQPAAALAALLLLASCGGGEQPATSTPEADAATAQGDGDNELLNIGGTLFSIPSPVQGALALKSAGAVYRKDMTTPLELAATVTGKVRQSMLLGIYGSDLAYATVHGDGQRSMATLQAIEKVGSAVGVSNAFDRSLIERFRNNLASEDSLLRFSGAAFRSADQYLKNDERLDVSTLVLLGGWVGTMHLVLGDVAGNAALMERVGEQRNTVEGLLRLVDAHVKDEGRAALLDALRTIAREYENVQVTYTYKEPVTVAAERTTYINSTRTVNLPQERLSAIAAQVAALRNLILA